MSKVKVTLIVVGAAIAAFFGYGFYAASTPDGQLRAHERETIAACWKSQERKSLPDGQARFIAGSCEALENQYRTKWNREP